MSEKALRVRIDVKRPMSSTVESLGEGLIRATEVRLDVNANAFPSVTVRLPLECVELEIVDE